MIYRPPEDLVDAINPLQTLPKHNHPGD